MSPSEETPLLEDEQDRNAVYARFTPGRKKTIVGVVSWAGLLPLFVASSFLPSIPKIAEELNSNASTISLAVSLSIVSAAIGSMTCAAYSTFYGRRLVYLYSLPFLCAGSVGVALSQSVSALMVCRFFQAFGASAGLSVGSGAIGDIYKLEERGTAMGIFFGAILLGPALAPLCGGLAAAYASWRVMQYTLGASGALAFAAVWLFLPETSHPGTRGIDQLRAMRRRGLVWVNPLACLWLLRSPNLLAVSMAGMLTLLTDYMLLVPMAYTIGARYGITNEAMLGACFIPAGLGNIIGAPIAGRLSDRIVARRKGEWVPEDRLRACLWGAALLVPGSVLASGLITHYIGGSVGLGLNLVCLFFNGLGVDFVLSPSASYAVDVVHSRSAESMAANTGARSLLLALATTAILPAVEHIGVVWTDALAAVLGWVAFALIWFTIRYGDRMRAWVDIGYSTADDN
ncbi:MFS general substrate transporter [Athelia psychrophila]|uniref:MFS general substrate transporter n=1 Tax=Athelia psychrophila TaxID=1759441 RepID=A0A167WEF7_9AGAM|nr:MFS general substrate transporter [Fibularhizoctonia sp. CBS 109695]